MTTTPALSIPAQYRGFFTDAQAEELIAQFQLSDADGSGAIDELEFCALLRNLSLHVTQKEASALVAGIDTDGNGLVDFVELVTMVVKLQQGDPRFAKLRTFLDALDTTPTSLLEREAAKFHMKVTYQLVEERAATKSTPAVFIMALRMEGKWIESGRLTLQAIGRSTRDAKFKVAEAALAKMKQLKPGFAYDIGEVPSEWRQWLFASLESGSSPKKVMQKLRDKGFSPTQNAEFMQRISTRVSSLQLRLKRTKSSSNSRHTSKTKVRVKTLPIYDEQDGDDRRCATQPEEAKPARRINGLHPVWVHWSQQELARGIDGRIVLDELVSLGFEPDKFPYVTQSYLRASYLESNQSNDPPLTPRSRQRRPSAERTPTTTATNSAASMSTPTRRYCFWCCLDDGDVLETELFVYGGQDANALQIDPGTRLELTPLQLVCKAGHLSIVEILLAHGATVDQRDASQRTPLMVAAREGHTEICRVLITHGASLVAMDTLGYAPLHFAAVSGVRSVADLILEAYNETLLVWLAALPHQQKTGYSHILRQAYEAVMHDKLRANERRRFHVTWCWDVWQCVHRRLFPEGTPTLAPPPRRQLMEHVVSRYHPRFVDQRQGELAEDGDMVEGEDDDFNADEIVDADVRERRAAARVARREWIPFDEVAFCVDVCLRESYKNAVNKQGRTALHVACDENLVCTHELMIHCLAETHGCDPELRDHSGLTPMELVLASRGRPGSPRGDMDREMAILTERRTRVDANDAERERQRRERKRSTWQGELAKLAQDFQELEVLVQAYKAVQGLPSALVATVVGWKIHAEPLSRNRLFVNSVSGFVQRQVPAKVIEYSAQRLAWKEKLVLHSAFVEQNRLVPEWEVHRVHSSDVYFFFNRVAAECQWLPPTETPVSSYRTKRIFQDQQQLADCTDANALALVFSQTFSTPLKNDCIRGRRLGHGWRECSLFGAVFYWNESTDAVSIEKPSDVLEDEATRYAQVLLRARSEEIDDLAGGWRRWYDLESALSFYFDDDTGACVLDVDADRDFLRRVRKCRQLTRIRDSQLTQEERMKRLEEHEWKQALERVRRREQLKKQSEEHAQKEVEHHAAEEIEHAEDLRRLESSVMSEHYDESIGKTLAYVDARFQREKFVFLEVKRHDGMLSINPRTIRPRHEIERAIEMNQELDTQEREHAQVEDKHEAKLSIAERRRVSRILWKTQERVRRDVVVCRYGCGLWFARIQSVSVHEKLECSRRRQLCRLGCGLVLEDRMWQKRIQDHEDPETGKSGSHLQDHKDPESRKISGKSVAKQWCSARIVPCPRDCGVFTPHIHLKQHMDELCVRRPIGDVKCRLGCGVVYTGGAHELLALEQTRTAHEQDDCPLRKVQCTWPQCRGVILAKDRNEHRRNHLISSGIQSFLTAEVHEFKVPKGIHQLKIQAWGAGGGSGLLKGQSVGSGGGGAFVEGVVNVFPGETLFFAIGSGGSGGKPAAMKQAESSAEVDTHVSSAMGGSPGGGVGHSGNKECACGGGGGFTSVYRHSAFGIEYILIAGGGGGGGTGRHGGGGSGLHAPKLKQGDDVRNGRPGGSMEGGKAGQCDEYNPICRFEGTDGGSLQGGDGAEFGGGGGGGLFGGGGGGFSPGIVGGGGGGSSYVNTAVFDTKTIVVVPGTAVCPGGMDRSPPRSVRSTYWDVVDGVVGEGGTGSVTSTARGNHGGVRIAKPGFYGDMHFYC